MPICGVTAQIRDVSYLTNHGTTALAQSQLCIPAAVMALTATIQPDAAPCSVTRGAETVSVRCVGLVGGPNETTYRVTPLSGAAVHVA